MKGGALRTIAVAIAVALVTAGGSTAAFVVTSKNIKNGTIQLVDMSPRAKNALRGRRGPQGPEGIREISELSSVVIPIPPGASGGALAHCPEDEKPIAGGFTADIPGMTVTSSRRDREGWMVLARNANPTVTGPLVAWV
jgi:hypothetical protein